MIPPDGTPCLSSGPILTGVITGFYEKPRFSRRLLQADVVWIIGYFTLLDLSDVPYSFLAMYT